MGLKIKASYVFNTLAFGLMLLSVFLYINFETTKENIYHVGEDANLKYVKSIADNVSDDIVRVIKNDIAASLVDDDILKEYVESDLKLFVTTKYKYIYLVSKTKENNFTIIAQSSENLREKNQLFAIFTKLSKENFTDIYKNKKHLYLKHEEKNYRGATYLKPIIINNKVEAILAVEFSLTEQNIIAFELQMLESMFELAIGFFIIIFIFILWFSYIDSKREREKELVFSRLEDETKKVQELNNSLEHRVKVEVNKNRAKQAQMIHQARLAQMGEMISMIAHQWRQPLSAISATSSDINLKSQLEKLDSATAIELSDNISNYAQHLSSTIDDFRDFFKPTKEKRETTYCELIDSVLSIIKISITNKNIALVNNAECNNTLNTYPNELKQVILNLIKNAEDVLLEKKAEMPSIKIETYEDESYCTLSISDNGGGIDPDIIENIFNPYFSTKKQKDGTGLGLYMSKTIIEEHCSGKLNVYNNNIGAVFEIQLPKSF